MIATKGASAATRLIVSDPQSGLRFPLRRVVENSIPRHELQTRRRLFTGRRVSSLRPGAFFRACCQEPHLFRVYLLDATRLLFSVPLLTVSRASRRDFAAVLFDVRNWGKLAILFAVGITGLFLYNIGLSSAHPFIAAGVLNLSPFWAALVTLAVSRKSIPGSPGLFSVALQWRSAVRWQ
jgi:hypothetical protein